MSRSTFTCAPLAAAEDVNRFPAHPYCHITWFIDGRARLGTPMADAWAGRTLPREMFGGPRSSPVVSHNTGPVNALLIGFYPQAFQALTGIRLAHHMDRFSEVADVLDASWQAMSQEVLAASDDDARIALIEAFLEPRWQAVRDRGDTRTGPVGDWVRALNAQAGAICGNGVRNIERRIKTWAGQPLRRLRRLQRAEQSFCEARDRLQAGKVSWAAIAADAGYADQAHLSRDMREIVGDSPSEWARKVQRDEGYWAFRIWS